MDAAFIALTHTLRDIEMMFVARQGMPADVFFYLFFFPVYDWMKLNNFPVIVLNDIFTLTLRGFEASEAA